MELKSNWLRNAALGLAALLLAAPAWAEDPDPAASPRWQQIRPGLFQDRKLLDGSDILELTAPFRAEDAAVVPISIHTKMPQGRDRYVSKLYLLVDKNPSPVAAVFTLTPESGRADIETRIRVEEYSHIRAVAEMNDGSLHMVTRYLRASGGCSAPAGKDLAAAMARLGKIKFRLDEDIHANQPALAQLMISHPQVSGLGMDQVTRLYPPAHYIRTINVSYAGRPILTAEVDFSISENPNFRFYFVPTGEGELKAEVVDSKDLKFDAKVAVKPTSGS